MGNVNPATAVENTKPSRRVWSLLYHFTASFSDNGKYLASRHCRHSHRMQLKPRKHHSGTYAQNLQQMVGRALQIEHIPEGFPIRNLKNHQSTRRCHSKKFPRSEEHTSELQSPCNLVCRLLLEKKKN